MGYKQYAALLHYGDSEFSPGERHMLISVGTNAAICISPCWRTDRAFVVTASKRRGEKQTLLGILVLSTFSLAPDDRKSFPKRVDHVIRPGGLDEMQGMLLV